MSYSGVEFQAGDLLFRRGDDGGGMYLIQDGEIEILSDPDEEPVAVLERGDFFGEMAVLEKAPRTHAARARTAVRLVELDADGLAHMLQRNPEIAVRMIRKLARRQADVESRLFTLYGALAAAEQTSGRLPPRARLIQIDAAEPVIFTLSALAEQTVGRVDPANGIHPDIDLTAIDTQLSTSRRHARILRRGAELSIAEENATNGTFVNGSRVTEDQPLALADGDEVSFGAVRLRLELE